MQKTADKIRARKLSEFVGAEVLGIDLRDPMADDVFEQILQTWYENGVILFRGQDLTEDQQWEFGTRFGPLSGGHIKELEAGRSGMVYISNIRENGKLKGILPDGEMHFHSDQCYREFPSQGTMLHAIKIPSKGGNTKFASCYAAYESLPEALRERIDSLKALNVYDYNTNPTQRGKDDTGNAPSWVHPVVRTHPVTGRKALFVNRLMTARIEGLREDESEELLNTLFDHIEQPRFVYEHVWRPGDVLLWDNRCVLHARTDFDPAEERLLRRITLKGEAVF